MLANFFLSQLAKRAARQAIADTISQATTQADEARRATADLPCRAGIVFAMGIEAGGTEDLLDEPRRLCGDGMQIIDGLLAGQKVAIVQAGVGQIAAARGAAALIAGHRPPWVISAGFAGGLHPEIARGDFLFADNIVADGGARCTLAGVSDEILSAARSCSVRCHVGSLVTVDRLIRTPAEKLALGQRHQALAVDMETLAAAKVCAEERTRFLSVRIISDAVDDELPREIERLLNQKSAARRAGAALGAILNRPGSLSDMLKLKEQALVASDQLARVLVPIIQRIAPLADQSGGST